MKECHKKEIRIHEVDEASFQTILTSFYTGFLSVCSQCVIRILKTGKFLKLFAAQFCETLIYNVRLGLKILQIFLFQSSIFNHPLFDFISVNTDL